MDEYSKYILNPRFNTVDDILEPLDLTDNRLYTKLYFYKEGKTVDPESIKGFAYNSLSRHPVSFSILRVGGIGTPYLFGSILSVLDENGIVYQAVVDEERKEKTLQHHKEHQDKLLKQYLVDSAYVLNISPDSPEFEAIIKWTKKKVPLAPREKLLELHFSVLESGVDLLEELKKCL